MDEDRTTKFSDMPRDIQAHIGSYLEPDYLHQYARVSKETKTSSELEYIRKVCLLPIGGNEVNMVIREKGYARSALTIWYLQPGDYVELGNPKTKAMVSVLTTGVLTHQHSTHNFYMIDFESNRFASGVVSHAFEKGSPDLLMSDLLTMYRTLKHRGSCVGSFGTSKNFAKKVVSDTFEHLVETLHPAELYTYLMWSYLMFYDKFLLGISWDEAIDIKKISSTLNIIVPKIRAAIAKLSGDTTVGAKFGKLILPFWIVRKRVGRIAGELKGLGSEIIPRSQIKEAYGIYNMPGMYFDPSVVPLPTPTYLVTEPRQYSPKPMRVLHGHPLQQLPPPPPITTYTSVYPGDPYGYPIQK